MKTCESGQSFEERRDAALFRCFLDTGARLSEITDLRWTPHAHSCYDRERRVHCKEGHEDTNDVDLDQGLLRLKGKGGRWRLVSLGPKSVRSLDRYLRKRAQHGAARSQWLWLGQKGRMTQRHQADVLATLEAGGTSQGASSPAPAHLRARVAL